MSRNILIILLACGVLIAGAVVGMSLLKEQHTPPGSSGMKKFASTEELATYLRNSVDQGYADMAVMGGGIAAAPVPMQAEKSSLTLAAPVISDSISTGADYTTTNVQVEGVDEADFVKNDAGYIYIISGRELAIVDATPPSEAGVISRTTLPGQPVEMFVKGDVLAVFSATENEIMIYTRSSSAPVPYLREATGITLYDISDRKNPAVAREVTVSGNYYDSRMIGDYLYIVTSQNAVAYYDTPVMPQVTEPGASPIVPDIYYYDIPMYQHQYYTITSLPLHGEGAPEPVSFLAGYDTTLYVSMDNLYLAYRHSPSITASKERIPVAPATGVQRPSIEETVIHRFVIDRGNIRYAATGQVPGHLLNQFSMDEYDSYLRTATTVEEWNSRGSRQYNNVYVMDSALTVKGRLEYIAPDESIYAARFMGDRLYLVTFKRIDPFFVIDLSNPASPGILGKLKLPGYSDYLHPYDSTHIIGVGKETGDNTWGGVSVSGLKLALFDVTDVNNPVLAGKVEIGEPGSDSEALHDHKAFLFDRSSGTLVLPVREVLNKEIPGGVYKSYAPSVWQGAYVFTVSPDAGFVLKGKVSHGSGETAYYYYQDSLASVKRSIIIGDALYTISGREIIVSDLGDAVGLERIIPLPQGTRGDEGPYRL